MKRIIFILSILFIVISNSNVFATIHFDNYSYDLNGKRQKWVKFETDDFCIEEDIDDCNLQVEKIHDEYIDVPDYVIKNAKEKECFIILNITTDNKEYLYPEISRMYAEISINKPTNSSSVLGKDYRLIYIDNETSEMIDVSKDIKRSNSVHVEFFVYQLGTYIVYYNPYIHNKVFYYDDPTEIDSPEIYYEIKDMKDEDIIEFPKIPEREGYIFTGWKADYPVYGGSYIGRPFSNPQPLSADENLYYFASWCPEDEYTPLEVTVTSDEKIIKGQEDGAVLTLSLSEGKFSDDIPLNWRPVVDDEDEEYYQNIIDSPPEWWKDNWNIIGNDDIMIDSVKKIDNKTLELTLSGNSSDIYSDSEIKIEFEHYFYKSYLVDYETHTVCEEYDVQLDEDGVMKNKFITDNSITLHAQKKPSRGGSLRPVEVNADTDKSSGQDKADITEENTDIKDTENVTDTNTEEPVIDTEASDDNSAEKSENDTSADNSIIFTIGSKTVTVSGEEKEIDVAPIIRNGHTMLPARFVAEALGAAVNWDEISRTVTVTKDDIKIVITIDSQTAVVNGEEIKLDSPAFIESGRTYTPLRLIAESLGASVDWDENTKTVTIKP